MNTLYDFVQLRKQSKEKLKQVAVTLPSTGWTSDGTSYNQTITVQGATDTNIIICAPEPTKNNLDAVGDCNVILTGQAVNELTFTAFEGLPAINLTFNLLIGGEG